MRGFGTVYQQKGSRFWWMQYWDEGQRHRESTGEVDQKKARRILNQMLNQLEALKAERAAPPRPGTGVLLGDLYAEIERDYLINQRKSLGELKIRWTRHLCPYFGSIPALGISAEQVNIYIAQRLGAKAANATVNRELAVLKRMYKLAIKTGRIKSGDLPYIPSLEERNVRKGFLKDAQYHALASSTARRGLWLRTMFEVAYSYGWRKSELLELKVSQVDMAERTIALNPGETKNDESRVVVMTAKIFDLIGACIAAKAPGDYVFTRSSHGRGHQLKQGGRIVEFRADWAAACKEAGVEGLLFHDLRRSGVRNLIRAGVTEKVSMTITGHKTRSVFERYNIVNQADQHDAVRKLDRAAEGRRQHEMFVQESIAFEPNPERKPPEKAKSEPENRHRSVIVGARLPN